MNSLENEYANDLYNIQHYKNNVDNLDYTTFMKILDKNEFSRIYIDNTNNNVFSINDHLHITHIEPEIPFSLIHSISDHSIPLYFIHLNNYFSLENLFKYFTIVVNLSIPIYFGFALLNLLNSIRMNNQKNNDLFKNLEIASIQENITLNDWAGSPEIIDECREVIDYIENKEKYEEMGATMPKGILLDGPPGTGKTLLAKAIAYESNNNFISISGSAFVELYVGVGASRIRELFETARQNAPCIIFIDEIDAIGKKRGNNINGNDEREQTLNQLLYEMDGFNQNEDILVMAATNRKDILDDALLRPGRFDRLLTIPLPDKDSRKKILELYLQNKLFDPSIDIDQFADLTSGFSGASLKNIINEATILTIRNNQRIITEEYLFEAFEKSIVGVIKKNSTISSEINERVALHEIGHTLLVLYNKELNFQKVSILPTYNGAGGYTLFTNKETDILYTKQQLKNRLMVMMGGKAMEELFYGEDNVSLGCSQDLEDSKNLATNMISKYGMGNRIYYEDINQEEGERWKKDKYIDVQQLLQESYEDTKKILKKNYDQAIELSKLLQEKKILYKKDLDKIL